MGQPGLRPEQPGEFKQYVFARHENLLVAIPRAPITYSPSPEQGMSGRLKFRKRSCEGSRRCYLTPGSDKAGADVFVRMANILAEAGGIGCLHRSRISSRALPRMRGYKNSRTRIASSQPRRCLPV